MGFEQFLVGAPESLAREARVDRRSITLLKRARIGNERSKQYQTIRGVGRTIVEFEQLLKAEPCGLNVVVRHRELMKRRVLNQLLIGRADAPPPICRRAIFTLVRRATRGGPRQAGASRRITRLCGCLFGGIAGLELKRARAAVLGALTDTVQ